MNRELLLISLGRLIGLLVGVISIKVATTYLGPEQYGVLAILLTIQTFCGLLLINPVGQHINRHTHQWSDDGTLLVRLSSYGRYILSVAFLGAIAAFALVSQTSTIQTSITAVSILLIIISTTWNSTWIPIMNMLGFRLVAVFWTILTTAISLITSLVTVTFHPNATAWILGQSLGMTVGAIGAARALRLRTGQVDPPKGIYILLSRKDILKYCLPLSIATGLMWIQLSGYRFVVRAYWGMEMLGYATVGLLLANQLFSLMETLAQQFLLPMFYRRIAHADARSNQSAMSDLLNFTGPLYIVIAGSIILSTPYLIKILLSPQFTGAEVFVKFGVGIECCRVLGNLVGQAAQITKITYSLIFPYAGGAIATIGLMIFAGEYDLGVMTVGGVLLVAAMFTLFIMTIWMYHQVNFLIDIRRWFMSLLIMTILCIPTWWLDRPQNWPEAIGMLISIGLISGCILISMIWRNSALQRMMAVRLHGEFK